MSDDGWLAVFARRAGLALLDARSEVSRPIPGARAAALSPDGRHVAWSSDEATLLAATTEGAEAETLDPRPATALYFSDDSTQLAVAFADGEARVLDVQTRAVLARVTLPVAAISVALSPDGARLLTVGEDALARVWDVATGRLGRLVWLCGDGWCTLDPETGRHTGAGAGLRSLTYEDAEAPASPTPTWWLAEDLPELCDGP